LLKEIIALFIGIISVSLAANMIKMLPTLTAFQIAFYRMAFAILVLTPFILFFLKEFLSVRKRDLIIMTGCGFALSLHFITWITSLKYISVASSVSLVAMNPIFVALIRFFVFKKRSKSILYLGIILGVSGSVLISYADMGDVSSPLDLISSIKCDIFALLGAFFASLYIIGGQMVRKKTHIFVYIYIVYFISFVLLLFNLLLNVEFVFFLSGRELFILILLGVLSQVIGHSSFNFALKSISAETVSLVILLEPVIASFIAYYFLSEKISFYQLIGMFLIISGVFIGIISEKTFNETC